MNDSHATQVLEPASAWTFQQDWLQADFAEAFGSSAGVARSRDLTDNQNGHAV